MDEQTDAPEIWFERIGPTLGWFGSYNPTTMRGFHALLTHVAIALLWLLPFALLGHFKVLSGPLALGLAIPGTLGCLVSLMRTAHRHSVPWEQGPGHARN